MSLHVAEARPEDGPIILLLHGFPEFWYGWRHQIDALAEAGYRVIAPDQRGYNTSDRPKSVAAYDLDRLAEDVIALAERTAAQHLAAIRGASMTRRAIKSLAMRGPDTPTRMLEIGAI